MQGIARQNCEIKYFLIVIDAFSKFDSAVPVYFLTAKTITAAYGQVLTAAYSRYSRSLKPDKGKDFFNSNS